MLMNARLPIAASGKGAAGAGQNSLALIFSSLQGREAATLADSVPVLTTA